MLLSLHVHHLRIINTHIMKTLDIILDLTAFLLNMSIVTSIPNEPPASDNTVINLSTLAFAVYL